MYILLYCQISGYKLERIWCNMFHSRYLQQKQKCVCYSNWRQVLLELQGHYSEPCQGLLYIIIFTYSSWLSSKYPDDSTDPACNHTSLFSETKGMEFKRIPTSWRVIMVIGTLNGVHVKQWQLTQKLPWSAEQFVRTHLFMQITADEIHIQKWRH